MSGSESLVIPGMSAARDASLWRRLATVSTAGLLAVSLMAVRTAGTASADSTAATDDHSISVPVASWWYTGVTTDQVTEVINANQARVTQVDVDSSTGRVTVRLVHNTGRYAVSAWWWYVGQTARSLSAHLAENHARLVDLSTYQTSTGQRFAAVMVANTGTQARSWWWLVNTTPEVIAAQLAANDARLVDLQSYDFGSGRQFLAVMVANTGADAKTWHWYHGRTFAQIVAARAATGDRVVELNRRSDGLFDMVSYHDADQHAWWWYLGLTAAQVGSRLAQNGARLINVHRNGTGAGTRYDALMIDNLPAESGRIRNLMAAGLGAGSYGFYLRRFGEPDPILALQPTVVFEPASALKVVYNAYAHWRVFHRSDALNAPVTWWTYPGVPSPTGDPKDVCPDPSKEIAANAHTTTLANALRLMMQNSDNRLTRAIERRYGRARIFEFAHDVAGMSKLTSQHQIFGCGNRGGNTNTTRLADLATLYQRAHNGILFGRGATRNSFYNVMPHGTPTATSPIGQIVAQEAAAQHKSAVVAQFLARMWIADKGGSYDLCFPTGPCDPPYNYVRSDAGRIWIPFRNGLHGPIATRSFEFGLFADRLPIDCSFGQACTAKVNADTAFNTARNELFRQQIRAALTNW
jgi:Beta-lactamase enzyme family